MAITGGEYKKMTGDASPKTPKAKKAAKAFLVGGLICAIGEGLKMCYEKLGFGEEDVKMLVSVTLIALAALLTAIGVFDKIADFGGAGTFVPITGFANAIVSPAMEFQTEGRVLGTGAQMFRIAGPVLAYGSAAAVIYGIIYYIIVR